VIDGMPLVDVHLHPARRATLKVSWDDWVQGFGATTDGVYTAAGDPDPAAFRRHLAEQGVDVALLMAEYSPRVTGVQSVEDLLALAAGSDDAPQLRVIANVNPHYHFPVAEEVRRQLALGAVALKVHPVHAGIAANDRELYPAYEVCRAAGVPVVVHCGTSTFPGAKNRFGDPVVLDDVIRDFPGLHLVLAHGGRGWWYDAAAFLALAHDRVWIELSGLPPRRLPEYYARSNWNRLVRRMIFGTDWPGIPGIAANARAVAALCPDDETRRLVLAGNAARVYRLAVPGLAP
jgi:predicted TIM-barrel fold metal-dependent hydrolase